MKYWLSSLVYCTTIVLITIKTWYEPMENKYIAAFEAKTKFSSIIQEVKNTDVHYIVTKRGEPMALIVPYKEKKQQATSVINDFIKYRDNKKLKLKKEKNEILKDIIYQGSKYYE